jgi:hypothetical protein
MSPHTVVMGASDYRCASARVVVVWVSGGGVARLVPSYGCGDRERALEHFAAFYNRRYGSTVQWESEPAGQNYKETGRILWTSASHW